MNDSVYEPRDAGAEVRVAGAVRDLIDALLEAGDNHPGLEQLADNIESITASLEPYRLSGQDRYDQMWVPERRRQYGTYAGPRNPIAPPLVMHVQDGVIHSSVRLPIAYQGPPGLVHGGVSAGLLDQLLGLLVFDSGRRAYTAELRMRYRRPIPLGVRCDLRGWITLNEPDRVEAEGVIEVDGVVCVRATGVFKERRVSAVTS